MKPVQNPDYYLREQVDTLLTLLNTHMNLATEADARVRQRDAELKIMYSGKHHTIEHLRARYKVDYEFNDRIAKYNYECQEVQRYSAMIQGLTAAQTFLLQLS